MEDLKKDILFCMKLNRQKVWWLATDFSKVPLFQGRTTNQKTQALWSLFSENRITRKIVNGKTFYRYKG